MSNISKYFNAFLENIQITEKQSEDAEVKYTGVCKKLHSHYYDSEYCGKTKFLFGSHKTKTQVGPMCTMQDVDVLFKIDESTYNRFESNPSGLLQEIRKILKERFPNTEEIHAWRKVVLVKFSEGSHNVEVLPGYENEDGTFLIPNTEGCGCWENFDPRSQCDKFAESNKATKGKTRALIQMIKKWVRNTASLNYKSFQVMFDVINFLNEIYDNKVTGKEYEDLMTDFFTYIQNNTPEHLESFSSQINTVQKRAVKAQEYAKEGKLVAATEEWRKVFGDSFPLADKDVCIKSESTNIQNPAKPWALKF